MEALQGPPPATMRLVVLLAPTMEPQGWLLGEPPAAAAVHDWRAPLSALTNGSVQLQAAGSTMVRAC